MKNRKIILGILVLVVVIQLVSATSIQIEMEESFGLGEEISFDYTILSDQAQDITYIASVNCPNAPLPLLEIKTASLDANIPLTETYVYMSSVSESIEPQTCDAGVGILSPEEILESKSFSIITNPSFEFNVLTCKDLGCSETTRVFVIDENIYLDYSPKGFSIDTTAILIYPQRGMQELSLPTSIKADQIGTYNLEVTASKGGHKTVKKTIQFGVIKQEANILYTAIVGERKIKQDVGIYILFAMIGVVLILIVFLFIRFFGTLKKRRKGIGHKKLIVGKHLKKGLKKKERTIKKKERRLLRRLFHRKKKLPFGKKQEVNKKIGQEKKILTKEKVGVRKEFGEKLKREGKELEKKEKKAGGMEKKGEIRRLLAHGRMQLSRGNKFGAKNTYRKMRRLHASLKPGEKNRELYNQILIFHGRLNRKVK
jgi:hypothetical protein